MRVSLSFCVLFCMIHSLAFSQWSASNSGLGDLSVGALYADEDTVYAGTIFGVYKSTNQGSSWTAADGGLPSVTNFFSIVRSDSFLVAGGDAAGIWRSSDLGASWTQSTSGVATNEYAYALHREGGILYAAFGYPPSIGISTDDGASWTKQTTGLPTTQTMSGVALIGSALFATHITLGSYVSLDNGASWNATTGVIPAQDKNVLMTAGANLLVGANNGVYLSTDSGDSWTRVVTTQILTGLTMHNGTVYAVGQSFRRSSDNGATWTLYDSTGIPASVFNTIQFAGSYAFVNMFGSGVYRRAAAELTGIGDPEAVPGTFALHQNYPNPFNPNSTIQYDLPSRQHVTLRVYSVLGEEVASLESGLQEAGPHLVTFDAAGLSSGVYYYQILAGTQSAIRSMILMR